MTQRLSELTGREISLVTRPANRRRFLLLKGDTGDAMDDVKALQHVEQIDKEGLGSAIEALAGADSDFAKDVLAKAMMTEDEKARLRAALRVMGPEMAKKVLKAAEPEEEETPVAKKDDEKPKDEKPAVTVTKNADGSWDFSALPETQRPVFEAVIKATEADSAKLREDLKKADERAAASEEKLNALAAEKDRAESIQKAAEFKDLPGAAPDDMGPILLKIKKALDAAEYEKLTQILKASAAIVRKSALFMEVGAGDQGGASAHAELASKAAELRKADTTLSPQAARAKVLKSDPDLSNRVMAEETERRQRAREKE